jgi:hypothetical protein
VTAQATKEEVMQDINKREFLFNDYYRLLEFVEKTVAIPHSTIWFIFKWQCKKKGYDLVSKVWRAAGTQEDFEQQNSEN